MVFEREPGAIVCGVDDVGVFGELQFVERVQQAAYFGVDVFDRIGIGIQGIGITYVIRNVKWNVRHRVWQIDEEGLVLVLLDKVDCLLRVSPRDRSLIDRYFNDLLIFEERRFPFGQG